MSNVLKTKVRRPLKVTENGQKTRLLPGAYFPFDPDDRAHKAALDNGYLKLERAEGADIDAILAKIRDVSGVGPALYAKIEEAIRGD